MKKLLLALLCLGLVGCASLSQVIAPNRANLLKLSIGMTKDDAIQTMGTKSMHVSGDNSQWTTQRTSMTINNPYRSEILQGKDKTFEVLYYVTDVKNDPDSITDDELTPLVFDDGRLLGWGWSFLNNNVQKYEIRLR